MKSISLPALPGDRARVIDASGIEGRVVCVEVFGNSLQIYVHLAYWHEGQRMVSVIPAEEVEIILPTEGNPKEGSAP